MGERILDMCAAPGGKTTAIAILMKDKGEVIATDRSHNKVEILNSSKVLAIPIFLFELEYIRVAGCCGITCINIFYFPISFPKYLHLVVSLVSNSLSCF